MISASSRAKASARVSDFPASPGLAHERREQAAIVLAVDGAGATVAEVLPPTAFLQACAVTKELPFNQVQCLEFASTLIRAGTTASLALHAENPDTRCGRTKRLCSSDEIEGYRRLSGSGSLTGLPARPPQIRTCGFPASGSSAHGFAGLAASWLWTIRGLGSGCRLSTRANSGQGM